MTFCFFSAQYLPTVGGVERYTNSMAKQLIKKGHKAVVVTSALKGLPSEETSPEGIKIYRMPVKGLMGGRFPVLIPNKAFFELRKKLFAEDIQFCVIQTRFYTNSIFGSFFAKQKKVPSIVIEHGTAHLIRGGIAGAAANIYEHMAFWVIRRNCKNIYGVSKACCDWLTHFKVKTDKVLYNAVDTELLKKEVTEQALQKVEEYILPNTQTVVCFNGRFIKEKGVMPLAKAFERVALEYPSTVLLMAGKGELFEQVLGLNCKNVVLMGEVDYQTSLAVFKRSDIFCLPTFSEGFATTILEAAAFETAILTTPTGGSPEIIIDNSYGILFDGMDENSIYTALKTAVSNPEWCKTAGENARKMLDTSFTWDKVSDKLIKIAKVETTNESFNSNTGI